ncbi:MAG: hypothetical protein ACRCTJ_06240 [Brevinema sp.]
MIKNLNIFSIFLIFFITSCNMSASPYNFDSETPQSDDPPNIGTPNPPNPPNQGYPEYNLHPNPNAFSAAFDDNFPAEWIPSRENLYFPINPTQRLPILINSLAISNISENHYYFGVSTLDNYKGSTLFGDFTNISATNAHFLGKVLFNCSVLFVPDDVDATIYMNETGIYYSDNYGNKDILIAKRGKEKPMALPDNFRDGLMQNLWRSTDKSSLHVSLYNAVNTNLLNNFELWPTTSYETQEDANGNLRLIIKNDSTVSKYTATFHLTPINNTQATYTLSGTLRHGMFADDIWVLTNNSGTLEITETSIRDVSQNKEIGIRGRRL